jgi:hypothetical protein
METFFMETFCAETFCICAIWWLKSQNEDVVAQLYDAVSPGSILPFPTTQLTFLNNVEYKVANPRPGTKIVLQII